MEHARGMGKPLEATSGHGDGWSVELDGGGGSAWRGLAGAGRSGFSRGLRHTIMSAKVREKVLKLTGVRGGRSCCARWTPAWSCGGAGFPEWGFG